MNREPHPDDEVDYKMRLVFACLIQDLLDAIEEFGYEAVYFGVGCAVFPDAVDPREDPTPGGPAVPE